MRIATHLALALAVLGTAGAVAVAYVPTGTSWTVNSTTQPFVVTKYKVMGGPSGGAFYFPRPVVVEFNSSQTRFMGSYSPLCPQQPTLSAMLWIPAVSGKAGDYGGKYAFSSRKADSMTRASFHSALAGFVHLLDAPLQNLTVPKVYKTSTVLYLGGLVEILDAKASGKGAGDADENVGAGRYKVSFAGTMVNGPYGGQAVKGQISIGFEDAPGE